jgi:hypothetical protein
MVTTAQFLTAARAYLGTPFRHHGRSRAGLDCVGLILVACRDAGLLAALRLADDYDVTHYSRYPASYALLAHLNAHLRPGDRTVPRAGQLGVFRVGAGEPSHLGILTDGGAALALLHAWNAPVVSRAKVIEHRFSPRWQGRLYATYTLPLADGACVRARGAPTVVTARLEPHGRGGAPWGV